MSFKNYAFYDKIVLGKVKTVKDVSLVPIVGITVMGYGNFGLFFYGSISPKGILVVENNGQMSLYQISRYPSPSKLLESITLLSNEE